MKVLIADDDPLVTDLLTHHLSKLDAAAEIEVVHAGTDALNRAKKGDLDLLVLDLEMPGLGGREVLSAIGPELPVIIVTGDPAFAVQAFRYNVVDYLIKPVDFAHFAQAWRKVGVRTSSGTDRRSKVPETEVAASGGAPKDIVFVREGTDIVRLDLREVRYIKSESNYARFHLDGRSVTSLLNLKDLELKLPATFIRVHRSYIVNLQHIEKLDHDDIKIGRDLIPVSDGYREELIKRLDLL